MNKWVIGLGILFATLSGVLFSGSYVSAASAYDETIETTDNLTLVSESGQYTQDVTLTWGGLLTELPCWDNIQTAIYDGSYAIVKVTNKTDGQVSLNGIANLVPANANFTGSGSNTSLVAETPSGETVGFRIMLFDGVEFNGEPYADCNKYPSANKIAEDPSSSGSFIYNPFINTYNVNYPLDYEGEIIPDSYTPPIVYSDTPDIAVVNIVDWKITLQDRNFNTFDNVPFTCDQGLTPVIQYDLYNNDTDPITKIDQGVFSPTVQYEFQSEKYGVETEYKFIGNYYCGTGDDQPTFSHQTTIYFTSSAAGLYVSDIITDCVIDEFPWVNIENCMNNMADAIQLLSFNTLRLPGGGGGGGGWGVSQSCYNMQVLDDWINSPNQQLCPMFPQYIRDIVTPFVTFGLGLLMLSFLTKRSGGGF